MSKLIQCKLSDIAEIVMGQSPSSKDVNTDYVGVPLLNGPTEFTVFYPIPIQYTDKGRKFANKGDLLFCVRGSTGKMNFADQKYAIGRGLAAISGKNGYSTKYIEIILKNNLNRILSSATGTTFTNVGKDFLNNFDIEVNDVDVANQISEIINHYDQKIYLNTKVNQTLEQIAQTIFKSWFIDFDPVKAKIEGGIEQAMAVISGKNATELHRLQTENPTAYRELHQLANTFPDEMVEVEGFGQVPRGWEFTTLSEICQMQNGYAFKSSDWTDKGIPVIKIGSIKPMIVEVEGNGFVSPEYKFSKKEYLLQKGDILVGLTGYVGEVGRMPQGKIAMLNQRVAKFIPNEKIYESFVYCIARQAEFKKFAESNAKGSAQANISTKELLKFPIIKADNKIHQFFEEMVMPFLDLMLVYSANNDKLAKTRDLLLPKLLGGEV